MTSGEGSPTVDVPVSDRPVSDGPVGASLLSGSSVDGSLAEPSSAEGLPAEDLLAEDLPLDALLPPGTRRAAVLGSPIAHSLSPALHRAAYRSLGLTDIRYDRYEVREDELAAFLDKLTPDWVGLSLTMPLKRVVIPLLDEITPLAAAVGAVNTLVFGEGDTREHDLRARRGDNTDVAGIVGALGDAGVVPAAPGRETDGPAVIIGGGATAASSVAALGELGWRVVTLAVRSKPRAAEVVSIGEALGVEVRLADLAAAPQLVADADVVIGTVPAVALGDLADQVRLDTVSRVPVLLDVIYDPWPTPFAAAWRQAGGAVVSGQDMLVHQAVGQVEQMVGHRPDVDILRAALD